MPDRLNIGAAMQNFQFSEVLCDLYNTVGRIEKLKLGQGVPTNVELAASSQVLVLRLEPLQPLATADCAAIANEMVGFTVRTGIPLFITTGKKPQE